MSCVGGVADASCIPHCYGCSVVWQLLALIKPLAWELPYGSGVALKSKKKKKKKKEKKEEKRKKKNPNVDCEKRFFYI